MNDIHFILYEFYSEFTQIQGKNDREIGKNHREFLTALVAGNLAHEKASYYLSKSSEKRQKRQFAGQKGAEKRWQNDSNANGNANGNGLALEENRIEKKRIDKSNAIGNAKPKPVMDQAERDRIAKEMLGDDYKGGL